MLLGNNTHAGVVLLRPSGAGVFESGSGGRPEFLLGGGADPETIYNRCLILKIML
jgi:hypothetical protein